jgi:hypothetical protein
MNSNFNNKIKNRSMGNSDKAFLGLAFMPLLIWLYFIICWIVNLVILLKCDFEGPWKEELLHAIGIFGP